ncbi:MAG: TolC family protein [Veillonellaceae bacterium]|jgi:outer membrane protein TolC|nr:TolC family protein [Veillonellaceae bacterium]
MKTAVTIIENLRRQRSLLAGILLAILAAGTAMAAGPAVPTAPTVMELTLDQAVQLALVNNPNGKIAVFDYEAAKGALTAARSYRWPTISATHRDSRTLAAPTDREPNPTATDNYSNSVSLSWILWSGNKIESQVSQAKLSLDSSQWGIVAARQQLKYSATDAYFKFMAARDAVKLAQESVTRLERYLQDVKLQFDVGVVAKVDVLRSEVELAKAKQTLIEAQNAYDITMANLNNVMGLPLTTELKVKGDLSYSKFEADLAACVDLALRQRPEIFQYTDAAKSAQEGIAVAKAGYLPSISATYTNGWNNTNFPGGTNYNWTVYLTTSWTFLDSGLTAGNVKKAVETYHKTQEQLRQTVDSVQLDVRSTYLSLKSAEQSIQTSSAAVGLAEEDYGIKVIRYQAGVGTNLDVLDAQVALTTAKNNYLKAMYDYNNYRSQLDKSMGMPVK